MTLSRRGIAAVLFAFFATPTAHASVGFVNEILSVTEGESGSIRIRRSHSVGTTTATITPNSLASASPSDYVLSGTSVQFNDGDTEKTISFTSTDDANYEGVEGVLFTLSSADGVQSYSTLFVSVGDNDPAVTIDLQPGGEVQEGAGKAVLTILRTGSLSGTSTVSYQTSGFVFIAAQPGSDYVATSGTLTFSPGQSMKTVDVTIIDDANRESDELIPFSISNPVNAQLQRSTTSVTIRDDDPIPRVTFAASAYSFSEGQGRVTIPVHRSVNTAAAVIVNVIASGSADRPDDYTVNTIVAFGSGETTKLIELDLVDDVVYEASETIELQLSSSGVDISPLTRTGITITDNDPVTMIAAANAQLSVREGDGSAMVRVLRTGSSIGEARVSYTTHTNVCCSVSAAVAGSDFSPQSGTLVFAPGETTKTIDIPIVNDDAAENAEAFDVALSTPVGGLLSNQSSTRVTILDDDPRITFSIASATRAVEGSVMVVTVRCVNLVSGTASVTYSASSQFGSLAASTGVDYIPVSGVLTFTPSETTKTFDVPILDDSEPESSEQFVLQLANPSRGFVESVPSLVTIVDDDPMPTVRVGDATVAEGHRGFTAVSLSVRLSASVGFNIAIPYKVAGGTASANDWLINESSLTIPAGQTDGVARLFVAGDTNDEGDETVEISLTPCVQFCDSRLPRFEKPVGVVTILDDDFSFSVSDTGAREGHDGTATATFTVKLSGPNTAGASVDYRTAAGSAQSGTDYDGVSGTLTFAPGETRKSVAVKIIGDRTPEANETFSFLLSNAQGAPISRAAATGTIVDDDALYTLSTHEYAIASGQPLLLDLYVPNDGKGPFPLVIWIHGDNWASGSRDAAPAVREAGRGYAVASIDYRLSGAAPFPAQIHDVKAAVRWLRANAARFELDADRFAAWGYGAGAHLAALLGTSGGVAALDDLSLGNPAVSSSVQAVVDWAGPIDLSRMQADALACNTINHDSSGSWVSLLLGCSITQCRDKAATADPTTYVTGDDPPFLIMHGANDCEVGPAQSTSFDRALRNSGVSSKLVIAPGAAHAGTYWDSNAALLEVDGFLDSMFKGPARRRVSAR